MAYPFRDIAERDDAAFGRQMLLWLATSVTEGTEGEL